MKIKVTFYVKHVRYFTGEETLERVELIHECKGNKSSYEHYADAFDEAVLLGMNPNDNVKFEQI